MKPLEIKDFNGGQTDNYFNGDPKRAERLHNLLIGIDHSLDSRSGSLVENIAPKAERINYIQSFNSLTDLLYASEGHFYDNLGAEILGPSGNIAFVGATPEAMYTSSELPQQLIVACDEILLPQKFYRDEAGVLQVRTLGLPKVVAPKLTDADLLTACIAAANSFRTKFLNHINSAENLDSERFPSNVFTYVISTMQPPGSTNAHWSVDKYAKSYLEAVVFTPGQWEPLTTPTPAPAATDYDSLVTLIQALALAFEEHRMDSAGAVSTDSTAVGNDSPVQGPNRYHALGYQSTYTDGVYNFGVNASSPLGAIPRNLYPVNQGIQQQLVKSYNPDSAVAVSTPPSELLRTQLNTIAAFLDDFAVKFALHEAAPMVHRYNDQNTLANPLVAAAFDYDFFAPVLDGKTVVAATPFQFMYCANYVQRAFKNHALSTDYNGATPISTLHTFANPTIVSGLPLAGEFVASLAPAPTVQEQYSAFYWDVVLAKLNIFTARYSYYIHSFDLLTGIEFTRYNQDASGGGPGAWTIHIVPVVPGTFGQGTNLIAPLAQQVQNPLSKISSFNAITDSLGADSYEVAFDATGLIYNNYSLGTFMMHPYPLTSGNTFFANYDASPDFLASFGDSPDIYNLDSWVDLMSEFYQVFKAHLTAPDVHYASNNQAYIEFSPTQPFSLYPAGGVQAYLIGDLLPGLNLPEAQPRFILPDTSGVGPKIVSYDYAFTNADAYTVEGDVTYLVESAPIFVGPIDSEINLPIGFTKLMEHETDITVTNEIITPVAMILGLASLPNDASSNYSPTNMPIAYRTTGDTADNYAKINLYTDVSSGLNLVTPELFDVVSDKYAIAGNAKLQDSLDTLYTNDGTLPADQPTRCKYTWTANGYVYYAGVYDGDTFRANRVIQSVQLAGDRAPATQSIDFPAPVVGGGSARNVNVCLTETGVYRLEGAYGTDGSGTIVKQQISNQMGGISGSSVVTTEIGLFFAGTNGYYYTDGYQCIRISQELFRTYKNASETAAQKRAIKGVYDVANRRVLWSVRSDSTKTDNDILHVFDINFGVTPSGAFTTLFGADDSWNPSAIGFLNNVLYIGDTDGYLYHLDENTKTDPLKDLLLAPNLWEETHVPWEYRSTMMSFGGTAMRKFFSRIHHVGKNKGDVAIQYYITADNKVTQDLAPMRFIDDGDGFVDQWRRVGGRKLRADLYQVGCKNGRFTVYNSDEFGGTPVFVSNAINVTTLDIQGANLPLDSVGMGLCFASDYYETEFEILSVVHVGPDSTVTIVDPLNAAAAKLVLAWEIRGFMKDQSFSLDALTIWFEEQGNLGSQYQGYDAEEGGGGNR